MSTTGNIQKIWSDDPYWNQVLSLDSKYFPRAWSESHWNALNSDHYLLLVDVLGTRVQAFALFGYIRGDDTAHLLKILILPDLRGSRLTQEFWQASLEFLKKDQIEKVYLEVEESNLRAIGFYKKQGFEHLRTVKGYYSDGASGLMMQLTLRS